MVYRLILSYRGGAYAGWQRQDNALAVQQVVEEALDRLLPPELVAEAPGGGGETGLGPRVVAAGRTDAGVHARAQAAHLELPGSFPLKALVHGTNRFLPPDVRVMAAHRVPDGFHARKDAASKVYLYRLQPAAVLSPLDAPFVVRVDPGVDAGALHRAAALLPGRHDWTAFALAGGSHGQPFRTVLAAEWLETEDGELRFRIEGEGFLRGMVRGLVGTLLEVGRGRRSVEAFRELLRGRPREAAGPTAPAHGLCLDAVRYPARWEALETFPG